MEANWEDLGKNCTFSGENIFDVMRLKGRFLQKVPPIFLVEFDQQIFKVQFKMNSRGSSFMSMQSTSSLRCQQSGIRFLIGLGLLLVILGSSTVDSSVMGSRPLSKRSFFDIQCKGAYDKAIFSKLDRVCDDCFNLYREPQLHSLCRGNCFATEMFFECLDALTMGDEKEHYVRLISTINAHNPLLDTSD
ncbi:unnamed protein product [Allacma fusca]|uniref:Uncharacterized protein n=1 Tax=Allacma fusca TaxID=39272 RepID=A0A8J2K6E4_9HEXA|nr:unnamed protein product [Allacma fusca]